MDLENKVNVINYDFASQLGLKIWKTNIAVQKINGTTLEIYKMIVSIFSILDKDGKKRFFKKSFLLADVNPDVMLKIYFLTINNVDINFQA